MEETVNKGGRPTKYSDDILIKTKEYIDSCEDESKQVKSGESEKFTAYKEKVIVKLPTIEGLSLYLGVHKDTIFDWDKQPEKEAFSDLLNVLRAKQCDRLINMSLSGDYNSLITKVLLSKHGYTDKTETELSGGVDLSKKPTWFDGIETK